MWAQLNSEQPAIGIFSSLLLIFLLKRYDKESPTSEVILLATSFQLEAAQHIKFPGPLLPEERFHWTEKQRSLASKAWRPDNIEDLIKIVS